LLVVVSISTGIFAAGQTRRDNTAETNYEQIKVNTVKIAELKKDLDFLKEGQREQKENAVKQFEQLLYEIRRQKVK